MDETRLRMIEQLQQFLSPTPEVAFKEPPAGSAANIQRYEHISRVLARFDYPQRNKRERGVVLAYLRHTSGKLLVVTNVRDMVPGKVIERYKSLAVSVWPRHLEPERPA